MYGSISHNAELLEKIVPPNLTLNLTLGLLLIIAIDDLVVNTFTEPEGRVLSLIYIPLLSKENKLS